MRYKSYTIKELSSGWCIIKNNDIFVARTIDLSEARRYIWLQLKGTKDEVEMITQEMIEEGVLK